MTTYTVIHDVMNPYNGLGALLKNISLPKVFWWGLLCLFCDFLSYSLVNSKDLYIFALAF